MNDFLAPRRPPRSFESLFSTVPVIRIQDPAACHEYKKKAGSSDGAKTYDTTAQ